LDFVGVAHVVQFDVATNAVEFIHRVGRTARAGRSGVSTTLYTEDRSHLVEGLRDALTAGEEVEHLFSRKRSFKLGIKKRARRAQEEEEEEEEEEGEPRGARRAWRRDE
jgi:superfamily II DNA/RNA helicase